MHAGVGVWRAAAAGAAMPWMGCQTGLGRGAGRVIGSLAILGHRPPTLPRALSSPRLFQANVSEMVSGRWTLLLEEDLEKVEAAAEKLRRLLPGINVDRFVAAFPVVLNADDFEVALEDARRIMPQIDVQSMLRQKPDMVLSLMKGKSLITYDQIPNPFT